MEPDKAVITDFRLGDINAYEIVFHAYYKALAKYAHTIVKDMDDAEDIVQQTFVSIWEKRAVIEVHTSLKALLYKSVHNACLNKIKQQQVRRKHKKTIQVYEEYDSTSAAIQERELQKRIEDALKKLPTECAKIFKLSRFEQLKYQEIADQLGLSIKTVENQMGKALRIMREELKDYLPLLLIIFSQY